MYKKLPKDFDASFFVGRILDNVSFSANTVYFGFDGGVSVTVMSSLQHKCPSDSDEPTVENIPLSHSELMQLTNHCVVQAGGDEDGTLTLVFDHGHVLKVFDDSPNYESYSFNDGKKETYV